MKKALIIAIGLAVAAVTQAQPYSFRADVSGNGQPILLIPGLTCHGAVWDATVKTLSKSYECHVVTLPGFAGQPPIETDAYLETVGNELISYLKTKKLKRPVIIGHSLGGFLSLYIGAKEPNLIEKLVVVDGLPFLGALQNPTITPEAAKQMADMMRNQMANQTPEQYEVMQPMMMKTMITSDEEIQVAMEWGRKSDQSTVAQAMYELYTVDLRPDLAKIKAPTLVLGAWYGYKDYGATKDMVITNYTLQFTHHPNYRLEVADTAKHFIMWDDPAYFMNQVTSFLNEKI